MNICAVIYGKSIHKANTLSSLKTVKNLSQVYCENLYQLPMDELTSDYIFFIKSGDTLSDTAGYHLSLNIELSEPDILYSDEKICCSSSRKELVFRKPDYSYEMILSMNYFRNLLCVKTALLRGIQRLESQNNENALYEIVLKILPKSRVITHVREVLYYNNSQKFSIHYSDFFKNLEQELALNLLEAYCKENDIQGHVVNGPYHGTFRLQYHIQKTSLVSIIIPFRDQSKLLEACVNSILEKSTYKHFEIIGVNNGSQEKNTLAVMQKLQGQDARIHFYDLDVPFNYAMINNYAVHHFAKGEYLVFLNNDTTIIEPSWIESMLEHAQRDEIGIVGAKLLYPDQTIQHCGVVCCPYPEHLHRGLPDHDPGYFYFPHIIRNYHVLTFACVMLRTALFKQVGGLYEKLAIEFNDVDICARISALGYRNVYTPYAKLYHYESKSRGKNDTIEKDIRRQWEYVTTLKRTPMIFARDSFSHEFLQNAILRELEKIQNTLSWRITRPLRELKRLLSCII